MLVKKIIVIVCSLIVSNFIYAQESDLKDEQTSKSFFQCDAYALDPVPEWSNVFRYVNQQWNYLKAHCEWSGAHHSASLPSVVDGVNNCSADHILEKRATDGCSAGGDMDKHRFKAACNEHDACYSTLGIGKSTCDDNFGSNLDSICGHYFSSCAINSEAFYLAVVNFGQGAYNNGQNWAKDNCALILYTVWKKLIDIPPMNPMEQKEANECFIIKDRQMHTADMIPILRSVTQSVANAFVKKHCSNGKIM